MACAPDPHDRAHRHLALCLAVVLSVAVGAPASGQNLERVNVGLGAVEGLSTRPGVSDAFGVSAELSLPLRTLSIATLGIDLGGVGFVTGEVVCVIGQTLCDDRRLSGFGYASVSGRWESPSGIAPVIRLSAGEWVGRTTSFQDVPHTTEIGFTVAAEVGLRLGRVSPALAYRVLGHTPQGRTNLPSALLRIRL
jgi:hypothetical protein